MRPDAMWQRPRWRRVWAISIAVVIHLGLLMVVQGLLNAPPQLETRYSAAPMQARLIDVRIVTNPALAIESDSPSPTAVAVDEPSERARTVDDPGTPSAIAGTATPAELEPAAIKPIAAKSASATQQDVVEPPAAQSSLATLPTFAQTPIATITGTTAARPHADGQPRLVAPDGKVFLPEGDLAARQRAERFPLKPRPARAGSSTPFSHRSPLPYVATRFDPLWVPDGETLFDTFLRKLDDKIIKRGSTEIAGLQINCVWLLVVAGCTWGVPPRIRIDELKKMRADVPMPRGPRTQPGS